MKITMTCKFPPPVGVPVGGMLTWFGERETGFTNIAASMMLEAQKAGKPVMYMDTEASFDPSFLDK
jgi:RecA/RadA recombinase